MYYFLYIDSSYIFCTGSRFEKEAWPDSIVGTIRVGGRGLTEIVYNPDNHEMYVASSAFNTVSVTDTTNNTVIGTINGGNGPEGIAYNLLCCITKPL